MATGDVTPKPRLSRQVTPLSSSIYSRGRIMSQVKEVELLHGVVIAKLVRSGGAMVKPVETPTRRAGSVYKINGKDIFFVKYRLVNCESKHKRKVAWSFSFGEDDLAELVELRRRSPVW